MIWGDWLIFLLLLPLALCWSLWLAFALLALLPPRRQPTTNLLPNSGIFIDVLIPAHNEELLLPRLLETLRLQTVNGRRRLGRILVVADHCTDRTASLAREAHVEVLDRQNNPTRGKPAALRDGLNFLKNCAEFPLDQRAVLILDADCTVTPNLLEKLALYLDAGHSVLQASYILDTAAGGAKHLQTPAAIAFALKNSVRPRGMARIGLPTQLFGTGMCLPAPLLETLHFQDHLTEDLKISHELLMRRISPVFVACATVRSPLPSERSAMTTQKLRWETGQFQTWLALPGMLVRLLAKGRIGAAVALLDWSAPPVAMAVIAWLFLVLLACTLTWLHVATLWSLAVLSGVLGLLLAYIVIGGAQFAGLRGVLRLFLGVPRFFFWKLVVYGRMFTGRGARSWQKTPRANEVREVVS